MVEKVVVTFQNGRKVVEKHGKMVEKLQITWHIGRKIAAYKAKWSKNCSLHGKLSQNSPFIFSNHFHLVQLLHNFLVAMVTIFPYQQGKPVLPTTLKKVSAKLE